jgi:DNA-binding Lrp family transcriptional regulator
MIIAYIMISLQPGNTEKAIKEIRKIENIAKISIIAGDYDIIVRVEVDDLEELLTATDKIQMISAVRKTTTQVVEKEITL